VSFATGSRLGPYEITSVVGVGGMGEVYRARDTRLERTVAIKVLSSELTQTPTLKARFEREARAISSLSHPHICHLYDVGEQEGTQYLVMEFLEGETLAARLEKGALPLKQALEYGIQIAEALDKAHKSGIVHRDLKPGNIMLTKSGAKLLDFGLAKPAPMLSSSPTAVTASKPLTGEGTIVGTYQYMAPEQVQGQATDARTDIFALGAVLYEMVSGHRAFPGKSQISVMSAILEKDPEPISSVQPLTPPALDHALRRALAKEPDERWQSAADLRAELKWIAEGSSAVHAAPALSRHRKRPRLPWLVAAALLVAVVAGVIFWPRANAPGTVRSSLMPPSAYSFLPYHFAISPDGARLAFVAVGADGATSLWVRALDAASAQQLTGTEGALHPFWAPDSRRIGFFADGKVKTVDLAGNAVRIVCDARRGQGGSWNRDDVIVFVPEVFAGIYRVAASGGTAVVVTNPPHGGQSYRWPYFLPDSRHFLFLAIRGAATDPQKNGLYAGSLDSSHSTVVSTDVLTNAEYVHGQLIYVRENNLMAQPFDADRLAFKGDPVAVAAQEVESEPLFAHGAFSASSSAVVFQSTTDAASRIMWFDSSGKKIGELPREAYRDPAISPDGKLVAFSSDDGHNGKTYIRLYDLARGTSTRLSEGGHECCPHWSPNTKTIVYSAYAENIGSIYMAAADGSSQPELLLQGPRFSTDDWSPDGRYLLYMNFENGPPALWAYDLKEKKNVKSFSDFGGEGQFSADGKWVAYASRNALFVQSFQGSARTQIATGGGSQPRWTGDGKKLFYVAPDRKIMQIDVDTRRGFVSGPPRPLFQSRIIAPNYALFQYDITADGKKFLINSLPEAGTGPLTLVTNWSQGLKQ